ncbi:Hypothetical protein SRAE_2000292800 [Strongyloides ratti]|uniref:Uncharacterized protein n=1 Tax=Strongyloides ratti TaxID=34506 RepID=A0A090LL69_STRRB|nr:Hypothetical protein SRAE_2000292800 [Strongyloides ratti]CEF68270.1 Hypothetical protein SRAE_2000292800 [Strongyloides ratti]
MKNLGKFSRKYFPRKMVNFYKIFSVTFIIYLFIIFHTTWSQQCKCHSDCPFGYGCNVRNGAYNCRPLCTCTFYDMFICGGNSQCYCQIDAIGVACYVCGSNSTEPSM